MEVSMGGSSGTVDAVMNGAANPTAGESEQLPNSTVNEEEVEDSSFTPNDVVLGKGNGINNLPGNLVFRRTIQKYRALYSETERMKKASVAELVLNEIASLSPPGRFLEALNNKRFKEVSRKRAIEKTCQALREKTKFPMAQHSQGAPLTRKVSPAGLPHATVHVREELDPVPAHETMGLNSVAGAPHGSALPVATKIPMPPQQHIEPTSSEESSPKPLQNTNEAAAHAEIAGRPMHRPLAQAYAEPKPPKATAMSGGGEDAPIWPLQDNDVLYGGRGRKHFHRVANQQFLELIKFSREEYETSRSKKRVAMNIITKWRNQSPPGRFLQQSKGDVWYEIPEPKILEKTCQALRDLKRERGPGGSRATIADRMVDPREAGQKPATIPPQPGPPHNLHPPPMTPQYHPPHHHGAHPTMPHQGHAPPHWATYPPQHSRGMYPPPPPPPSHLMYNGNPGYHMPPNPHHHLPPPGAAPPPPPPGGHYHGVPPTVGHGHHTYPQEPGGRESMPPGPVRGPSPATTVNGQPPKLASQQPGPPQNPASVAAIQRQASIVAQEMQKMDDMVRRANSSGSYEQAGPPPPPTHWHPPHPTGPSTSLPNSRSSTPVVEAPAVKHQIMGAPGAQPGTTANPRITPPTKMAVVDIVPRPCSAPPQAPDAAVTRVTTNSNVQRASTPSTTVAVAKKGSTGNTATETDKLAQSTSAKSNKETEREKANGVNDDAAIKPTKENDKPDDSGDQAPDPKPANTGDKPAEAAKKEKVEKARIKGELEAATLLASMLSHSSSASSS